MREEASGGSFAGIAGKRTRTKDDDDENEDWGARESRCAIVCLEAIDQEGQHCCDTRQYFFPGSKRVDRGEAVGGQPLASPNRPRRRRRRPRLGIVAVDGQRIREGTKRRTFRC
jgi:hypothetical protein